jgi:lactoylglutathione lyase
MKARLKTAHGYQKNHLDLPVANLDAALPFYQDVLGFRVLSRQTLPHALAILGRDDIEIGLAENGRDPTQDGCAFQVTDAAAAFAEFARNGLKKAPPIFDLETHGDTSWKVFYVVAPDGLCYWFGEKLSSRRAP